MTKVKVKVTKRQPAAAKASNNLPPAPLPDPIADLIEIRRQLRKSRVVPKGTKRRLAVDTYKAALHLYADKDAWLRFCKHPEWEGKSTTPRSTTASRETALLDCRKFAGGFDKRGKALMTMLGRLLNDAWNNKPRVSATAIGSWIQKKQNAAKTAVAQRKEDLKAQSLTWKFEPGFKVAKLKKMTGKVTLKVRVKTDSEGRYTEVTLLEIAGPGGIRSNR